MLAAFQQRIEKCGPIGWILLSAFTVACALLPRVLLDPILAERSAFMLFTLAVMVSARFCGFVAGVIATGFSIVAGLFAFIYPLFQDRATRVAGIVETALFAVVGVGISYLAGQLRTARVRAEKGERRAEMLVEELRDALAEVKTLSGLLPICAGCKKIRNEEGRWEQMETYISSHSDAEFSHGLCPDCMRRLYPEYTAQGRE